MVTYLDEEKVRALRHWDDLIGTMESAGAARERVQAKAHLEDQGGSSW